jgi:hypothetical protein
MWSVVRWIFRPEAQLVPRTVGRLGMPGAIVRILHKFGGRCRGAPGFRYDHLVPALGEVSGLRAAPTAPKSDLLDGGRDPPQVSNGVQRLRIHRACQSLIASAGKLQGFILQGVTTAPIDLVAPVGPPRSEGRPVTYDETFARALCRSSAFMTGVN